MRKLIKASDLTSKSSLALSRILSDVGFLFFTNTELGIPSLVIDADHMDERNFSIAQFQTRADAFMEMLISKSQMELFTQFPAKLC